MAYGDSKTLRNEWEPLLSASASALQFIADTAIGLPGILARGGTPIATMATLIDSDLAQACGADPNYILIDTLNYSGYVGADYQTALGTVLDKMHAKWPTAKVYVARPWWQGNDANSDDWATRIASLVAARSTWAFLGHDERVWLKGADNGATMTADGVHYSAAGNAECARQWKTVLGY